MQQNTTYNIVVIGGGPAGLSAAIEASKGNASVLLIERESRLGGILKQCIHDGFGVIHFGEKLTGPEYADRLIRQLSQTNVDVTLFSFVTNLHKTLEGFDITYVCKDGVKKVSCQKIILATGCRERTKNGIFVQGDRCSGVYTAGSAQNLVNVLGVVPGKRVVILGSGDIGLIMARRLTLEGAKVLGVYEAKPTPSGLSRNIHQCLNDFDIPLYLSKTVTRVNGTNRLQSVEICAVDDKMQPLKGTSKTIECDTLILAVGLIPENEIAQNLGVKLSTRTKGAVVDQNCQTLEDGIYSCGNALHVNDLVDYVSESGQIAGKHASMPAAPRQLVEIHTSGKFAYVVPHALDVNSSVDNLILYFRSASPLTNQQVVLKVDGKQVFCKKYAKILPPEMERIKLDLGNLQLNAMSQMELVLEEV